MLDGFQNNYLFWRTLTDSTKERFGQLRHGQSAGVWGRVTAGSLSQGDLTNDYQTYRLGADTSIQPGLSLGAMFEIHEGDLDTSNGKGDMQAITAAIYGLYVSPSGYYADAGFRFGVMDYEYKNTALLYDEYDYNSSAVGAWLEVGKEWALANNYTLTPHLAVNFGRFGTEHFTSDNGLKAKVDSVNSVIFTVGTDVGYKTETFEVSAVADLTIIAGQKPVLTRAKKSLAAWKLRAGMPIGAKVTLRGTRMYQFLDKFMNIALPRVRDFRGVSPKAFDGRGNYSVGLKEQLIFPEIEYDKIEKIHGMNIIIVTTAKTDEEARALLKLMGMPFSA